MQNRILAYSNHFLVLALFILLLSPVNSNGSIGKPQFKNDIDSLKSLVQKCTSDTCKFAILSNYFWQRYDTDFNSAKPIGEWAFNVIRNSKNLKACADGYDIKGNIFKKEEKFDSAYFYFESALKISKSINYKYRMAWSYYHLGELSFALQQTETALNDLKNAAIVFTQIGDLSTGASKSLWLIAFIYEYTANYDSAVFYYQKRIELNKNLVGGIHDGISFNIKIAGALTKQNKIKESVKYLNHALIQADSLSNGIGKAFVYESIGRFFSEQKKNYALAINYYNKALDIISKDNDNELRTSLFSDISYIYIEQANDSMAMLYARKSFELAQKSDNKHLKSLAFKVLGYAYKNNGNYNLALHSFESCYETGCPTCPKITFYDALAEMANLYLKLNDPKEALLYYQKALELSENYNSFHDIALSNLYLGNYFQKVHQPGKVEKHYLAALRMAEKAKSLYLIKDIADTLSHFYIKNHNIQLAYSYQELARQIEKDLSKTDKETILTDLEMKFEFEKLQKQKEAEAKATEIRASEEIIRQKIIRNSFILISVLLGLLGFIVFISYKRKKNDNRLLTVQRNEILEKNHEIQTQIEEITSQKNEIEHISNELHEADNMKLSFFSNISHEFRTPLTLILNPVQSLLNESNNSSENKKLLGHIYNNALKLLDLTNQIMDLQKLDAGKLQLNLEKADVVRYCLGITSSFESLCNKKNVVIRFSTNHHWVVSMFDKDKIGKILANLLSNALKFCYEDSVIEVDIKILDNKLRLSVIDKGIGIPNEQIDHVFKRYYQASSNNRADGTGIGLAYVKELTGYMNGEVNIDSILKEGTKVVVAMPFDEMEIIDISEYIIDIPNTGKAPKIGKFDIEEFINENENEHSVLIVEDNDELRAFIDNLLKKDFNVFTAKDGNEGLQVTFEHIPDLIISDVMMPNMDGFELCSRLKKDERTSHIPVILLTAKDTQQSSIEGFQTGADDYIIKPFDNEILKLKVSNIIATHEAARKQFDFNTLLINNPKNSNPDKEFLRKCVTIISNNIDDSAFSVDKLAEGLAFSSRNLYRKIQALTGQTPAELIRVYRLHYAKQLLQNSKMKVFEIASSVGYNDVNGFRSAFKKQFGHLPSESLENSNK